MQIQTLPFLVLWYIIPHHNPKIENESLITNQNVCVKSGRCVQSHQLTFLSSQGARLSEDDYYE